MNQTEEKSIPSPDPPTLVPENDNQPSGNSPEAAGLTRGAARTAAAAKVARVSGRISSGYNVYEAATTTVTESARTIGTSAKNTAAALSKRVMIGRIPKQVANKAVKVVGGTKHIPRPPTAVVRPKIPSTGQLPKALPKRLRLQRVAKASDRISTGFDLYEAATTAVDSSIIQHDDGRKRIDSGRNGNKDKLFQYQDLKNRMLTIVNFSGSE